MSTALVGHLDRFGSRPAVLVQHATFSYADLARRVAEAAARLGPRRRLVLLETRNDLDTLVWYLGALAGGHVVLPAPAGSDHTDLLRNYRPDAVIGPAGVQLHPVAGHAVHADLALLMSTSGSTGSPKLVRLSRRNVVVNATAIAEYLGLTADDRAVTTLPMSYCYGLSVVHSHLLVGAALILTDRSVSDDDFWAEFRRHRATSLAGVPYTFELLERVGFPAMDVPHLRYLTQAGGRMPPDRVRRFATLGLDRGWQLYVMYGATEATARMAYLPPHLAHDRPGAIGRPVPGGSFTIDPLDDGHLDAPGRGVGELVYRGPNVMMGYAETLADLADEPGPDTLRTGDLARRAPDGLYEVVGRTSRFVKLFGLRIDLDRIEAALRDGGVTAMCTDVEDDIAVVATGTHRTADVRARAAAAAGVHPATVRVACVPELPLLPSGKPDYPAVRVLAAPPRDDPPGAPDLRHLYAAVLHLDPAEVSHDASFVDLGGNSLTYVAMSVRLEKALDGLPADWPRLPIGQLEALFDRRPHRTRSWNATLETSVALRAAAIVLIVVSHAELAELWGGAHILLGIAGYNFGRFCLTPVDHRRRIRHLRHTIAWIAGPSAVWVAVALVLTDDYHLSNLVLANKFLGPHDSMTAGRLWFVEVLVWTLVLLTVLFRLPFVDRVERSRPLLVASVFLAVGLALRWDVLGLGLGRDAWFTMLTFWFFALGWAASKATTALQRAAVTVVLIAGLHTYFDTTARHLLVLGGLTLLIWVPALRYPAVVAAAAGLVAEASLYTYLTHFQIYPLFGDHRVLGVVAALAVGILLSTGVTMARTRLRARRLSAAPRAPARR